MTIQTLWVIAISIATPIASVVGFGIQLRQIKKVRLENEKLLLEIAALQKQKSEAEQRIARPTINEVLHINHERTKQSRGVLESRARTDGQYRYFDKHVRKALRLSNIEILIVLSLVVFSSYLVYDFFRLIQWLASLI